MKCVKAIRFWFILIRNTKYWYNTQINRVKYQKTTDSRYCSPYTPLVTYDILCSYSSYSREHMSSSYTLSCQFSRRLEESATLDVIQPLDAGEKYVFLDWSAVVSGGCCFLLGETDCKEGSAYAVSLKHQVCITILALCSLVWVFKNVQF